MYFFKKLFIVYIFLFSYSANAINIEESLSNIFSSVSSGNEVLHPDDAFKVDVSAVSNDKLLLKWQIEPGYYLYKDKFSISANDSSVLYGDYIFPLGKLKDDLAFGEVEVYYNENQVLVPFSFEDNNIKELGINITYQGCKEGSICYPPIEKSLIVPIPDSLEKVNVDT